MTKAPTKNKSKKGKVFLVGAGPGDPALLTLRASELLQKAEVVFHDHLVHPQLLTLCPQAKVYYVGKVGFGDQVGQEEIQQKLIEAAQNYSVIVRLKGGDPFIFGRGGEEAQALVAQNIPFEVVPGVSSLSAVPAYAGIPVTHRDFGSSLGVITGHGGGGSGSEGELQGLPQDLDWSALAKMSTLVILMGVKNLSQIISHLIAAGKDPQTPAAAIAWGTYPKQKILQCLLTDMPQLFEKSKLESPAVVVVGEGVRLRESLQWFEKRPLFGRRILVSRTCEQASVLSERLRELGAEPVEFPTLQIQEPSTWQPLDQALVSLADYDWILFSSVNGVERFFERFTKKGLDIRSLHGVQIGAVGSVTAQALVDRSLLVAKQPQEFTTDALAESFSKTEVSEKRILLPRPLQAREQIVEILKERGAQVDVVPVYQMTRPVYTAEYLDNLFTQGSIDALSFASSATVQNFCELLKDTPYLKEALKTPVVSIGPVTSSQAKKLGFEKIHTASESTIDALVQALLKIV